MSSNILKGVSGIFDDWLGLTGNSKFGAKTDGPKYQSKTASIELSKMGGPLANEKRSILAISKAIDQAMKRLESNLHDFDGGSDKASESNWKWEKSYTLSPKNKSPEKVLEKIATFAFGDDWVNQVPTCNGLVPEGASACRIDLAHRINRDNYELIELKFGLDESSPGSNSPVSAAIELLEYALLYLLFRKRSLLGASPKKDHHLLRAKSIDLIVLAPIDWYSFKTGSGKKSQYCFSWLEKSITDGLQSYLHQNSLNICMSFQFQSLPVEFTNAFRSFTDAFYSLRDSEFSSRANAFAGA